MKNLIKITFVALGLLSLNSCKDFLDVQPEGALLDEEAIQTTADLQQFLNGAYAEMTGPFSGNLQIFNDLLGDDLNAPNTNLDFREIYNRNTLFFNGTIGGQYGSVYRAVSRANFIMERFDLASDLTESERVRIEAECRFLRALGHYYIVTLFAQPYGYSPNNDHPGVMIRNKYDFSIQPRPSTKAVYEFIMSDLDYAEANLPSVNDVYATKWAAKALKAKVHFQKGEFGQCAQLCTEVLEEFPVDTDSLGYVRFTYPEQSPETIFGFISGDNGNGGIFNSSGSFVGNYRSDNNPNPELRTNRQFLELYDINPTDKRLSFFTVVNDGAPNEFVAVNKFNSDFLNVPVLHSTDMLLMRAECLAAGDPDQAIDDINLIRDRAYGVGVNPVDPSIGTAALITVIRYERRIEMFAEGDRVQQLKRRGALGEQITIRNSPWDCPGMILQFPISEKTDLFDLNEAGGC
jgi:hypothetical protein